MLYLCIQKTAIMRKVIYLIILLIIFFAGCKQSSNLMQQLTEIDSIANQKGDSTAYAMLEEIAPETINDEESLAYYWLLRTRTELNMKANITSVKPLDYSIQFYKKTNNKKKLARVLYYKGNILNKKGLLQESVKCLKEVENLIQNDPEESVLADYLYYLLSNINYKAKEKEIAVEYAKLALKNAYRSCNHYSITYDLMALYIDYNEMGNKDSAYYYLNKCIPLLDSIPQNQRSGFYANIGNAFIDTDINKAEEYLNKSTAIKPNVFAFKGLARIYYKRGERQRAKEMWQKALQTDNRYLKVEILQAMYDSQQEEGDYKTASETAMKIAALKDSIAQKEKKDDIRGLQQRFDSDLQREHDRARLSRLLFLTTLILLIVTTIIIYLYQRSKKERKELLNTQQQLEGYRNQLKILQKEGKTDTKEVERLTQKISELQAKQGAQIQNGRERYEEIMAGGTTVRWSRNDFNDCIEYCRTLDAAFITHMEQDYNHLSAKYILFAFMEQQGKSDEELQHIMAISQSTVRSYRSRIHSAASHHHE